MSISLVFQIIESITNTIFAGSRNILATIKGYFTTTGTRVVYTSSGWSIVLTLIASILITKLILYIFKRLLNINS